MSTRVKRRRRSAFLNNGKIRAAYTLYESGLSVPELAGRLWERYGFASAAACERSLRFAFHAEGLRVRSLSESARIRVRKVRPPNPSKLTDEAVAYALARRAAGVVLYQTAGDLWEQLGYGSRMSCAVALYKRLGSNGCQENAA